MTSNQSFASPTESEFSDAEGPESAKNWDEERVCDWLRSINCGEYEKLFRKNNINGENLLEMDKAVLQEMGIDKIGDRVRLFLGIKKLRTKAYANQKKRNRVSEGTNCPADGRHNTDLSAARIPLLVWTRILRRPLVHPDHPIPAAGPYQPLLPIRDTQDSLMVSTLLPPFQRTLASLPPDRIHLSQGLKSELSGNKDMG
jgi:SAM domain (Sterile alpha motif)